MSILQPLASLLAALQSALRSLTDSQTPLLPFIPKPLKLVIFLLLLINSSSFPFTWHIRVWYYPLVAYWQVWTKGRRQYLLDWKKTNEKAGGLLGVKTRTKRIATLDDCDYNLHLSNSCYAKNGDAARMDLAIQALSPVFTPGIHMAMGASHYVFFKEIPIGSEYVMEARTGGWGDKWFYVVTEYIIYPKKSHQKSPSTKNLPSPPSGPIVPTITATPASRSDTPEPSSSSTSAAPENKDVKEGSSDLLKRATYRARQPRSDGGVVCSMAVNEYCFKLGRVTVPPRIAFHLALQSSKPEEVKHALDLILSKDNGRAWAKGGWKSEPNAEKLGTNLNLGPGENVLLDSEKGDDDDGSGERWFDRGRKGMEKVVEGLSVF